MNKCNVEFIHGDEALLDQIGVAWEALNRHLLGLSTNFKKHYMTFDRRKADLLTKAVAGKLRIDLAIDKVTGQRVGYCVSSLNVEKMGEVDSIFVDPNYRGLGIGTSLMKKALSWMDQECAKAKIVEVTAGNEEVFGFYSRYGFLPRKMVLRQVKTE